jgi:type II secretory ATPase GspE/PulE/Tfp pilus assembly ATPase PilB-like protein
MSPFNLQAVLDAHPAADPEFAVAIVDALLAASAAAGASDLHLLPTERGLDVRWRIDGVLQPVGVVPREMASNIVTRIKVLARLLTYQTTVPQEGRIALARGDVEVRVSTFPTLFGEKVVARNLPTGPQALGRLDELGLPPDAVSALRRAVVQTSGAVLIAGPAGCGKTTTAYACLREILAHSGGGRSVASLEDPVESVVAGVAQSQVAETAGFDLLTGLRSLVRQDAEVIFIGEIRDPPTAAVAMQAALTGQLVITTFHASDAAVAASRLADLGVPPYVIRSGIRAIVSQRLLRRLCACALAAPASEPSRLIGAAAAEVREPRGCERCRGTGYLGRMAVAETMAIDGAAVSRAILDRQDAARLRQAAEQAGMRRMIAQAAALVDRGDTSAAEVVRVFGDALA